MARPVAVCLLACLLAVAASGEQAGLRKNRARLATTAGDAETAAQSAAHDAAAEPAGVADTPTPAQATTPSEPVGAFAPYASFLDMQAAAHAQADAYQQQAALQQYYAALQYAQHMNPHMGMQTQEAAEGEQEDGEEAPSSLLQTQAQWGFGRGFQPQLYGYWQQKQGKWNFGADKRIECEACTYVTYMLIDRLGDQFNRDTIRKEAELTCSRVQWVFQSACEFVLGKNRDTVSDLVMKLIEPHDVCKHLNLCQPDMMDLMGFGGMNGYSPTRLGMTLPPAVRARMADRRAKGSGSGSGSGNADMVSGFAHAGLYGMQTVPFGALPLGLQPLGPNALYGMSPMAFFGGKGSGSGSGSAEGSG